MKWAVYKPSKIYDDRENVPRTETPEILNEESKFNYQDYSNKFGKSGSGIEYVKYSRVIETFAPISFEVGDGIKFIDDDVTLKIKEVEKIIPDNRKKAVDFWGVQLETLKAKKRISLQ